MRLKKNTELRIFSTNEGMNESAAQLLVDVAQKSVEARGRFVIGLSGGNTPMSFYTLLASIPYRDLVPWKNTFIFFGDERCVPADDERNNAFMATSVLISKVDLLPSNIFPIPVDLPPADSAAKYEETLRSFFGTDPPEFDMILLGLGVDGHTASLFPGTAVLKEQSHLVKEVYVEEVKMYRVTLTLPLINSARHILFLVESISKSNILEKVLTAPFEPEAYPAQLIQPVKGEVSWYVDENAASALIDKNPSFGEQ